MNRPTPPDWPVSRSDAIAIAEHHARTADELTRVVPPRNEQAALYAAVSTAWSTLAIALGQQTGEL